MVVGVASSLGLLWTFWYRYEHICLFLLGVYLRVIVLVCLTLVGTTELFSKVAEQSCTPISGVRESRLHHISPTCDFDCTLILAIWVDMDCIIREGNGTPLQYSCLENPMDGGTWWAAVHGVAKSWTRLSDFTFNFYFHALEKEMATLSSVLAWRIPGTVEPGGLPSMGLHRVGHDWNDLVVVVEVYHIVALAFLFLITNVIFHMCFVGHSCVVLKCLLKYLQFFYWPGSLCLIGLLVLFCSFNLSFSNTSFANIFSDPKSCLFNLIVWSFHSQLALFNFYLRNL